MSAMDLGMSERLKPIHEKVARMVRDEIMPLDEEFLAEIGKDGDRWTYTKRQTDILEGLKAKAKERKLWNFWLTDSKAGYGLTTVEYAYLAEEMGKAHLGAETFNCSAPDTGNMEVLERYGRPEHKDEWLKPLLAGEIRSAYLMTEPDVASSDATNIAMRCERDGDDYVLNGEKWWSSGAGDPRCKIYIVMVRTSDDAPKHAQHSMILVPASARGVTKLRAMKVYGDDDAPHGHLHLKFENVRVPASNLLLGEGRGFEIAQGRLGPGRIHHCMRAIGQAEMALELMCRRSMRREAFGKPLAQLGANYDIIAECRMEIEQARLLCLKAAWMMDQGDRRAAAPWISQIKVVAPRVALKVTDEAVQMFGGQGISQDTPLARSWTHLRTLRLADGPDAVHRRQVARDELKKYTQEKGVMAAGSTMRALLLTNEGYTNQPSGSVLEAMEPYVSAGTIGVPEPKPSQVVVKVSLASINPSDVMFLKGMYGQPRVKGQPAGFEGVGTVVAAGTEPQAQALTGKRVAFAVGVSGWGSWAEYAVAEAAPCIPLIDGVRDEDGAAMIVNPLTALAMFDIVREEGEKAFVVTAAASQLCKLMMGVAREEGFRPIAVVRRGDQETLLKEAGAAVVLNAEAPDYRAQLAETLKAEKPRIFLDAVTGKLASDIFHGMGRRSRWIIYGRLAQEPTTIREPGQLIFMHKKVEGFWLTEWMRSVPKERRAAAIADVQKRFSDGRWATDVTAVVPLDEAMARVPEELARPNGKVFIKP